MEKLGQHLLPRRRVKPSATVSSCMEMVDDAQGQLLDLDNHLVSEKSQSYT